MKARTVAIHHTAIIGLSMAMSAGYLPAVLYGAITALYLAALVFFAVRLHRALTREFHT